MLPRQASTRIGFIGDSTKVDGWCGEYVLRIYPNQHAATYKNSKHRHTLWGGVPVGTPLQEILRRL